MKPDTHLYDAEHALVEIARSRRRRDTVTVQTSHLGDRMASYLTGYFGSEALETVGLTLVHTAACVGGIFQHEGPDLGHELQSSVIALTNLLAFAGQRIVTDARASEIDGVRP